MSDAPFATTRPGRSLAIGSSLRAWDGETWGRGRSAGADRTVPRSRVGSRIVEAAAMMPPIECPNRNRSGVRACARAARRASPKSRISAPTSTRARGPSEVPWPAWS